MRIAIANDVPMAAEALRRVVASTQEHQVAWIARTGLEAVQKCCIDRPDLVLMDLNMPELDGIASHVEVRARSASRVEQATPLPVGGGRQSCEVRDRRRQIDMAAYDL